MRKIPRGKSISRLAEVSPPSTGHLRILRVVSRIPRGRITTYGRVAKAAGLPGRARLVGALLARSPLAAGLPWHRVVSAQGRISVRGGDGPNRQRRLLESEGVRPDERGRYDLRRYGWAACA
jgi:methylated-DNA-protein-cysteine methyltransferase-like protein